MRKDVCDCCGGELIVKPKEECGFLALLTSPVSLFRCKAVYKITQFTVVLPFGASHKDLDICSKCMEDFKEFVQRKTAYHQGDKK